MKTYFVKEIKLTIFEFYIYILKILIAIININDLEN
jgi:hypothetical protein